MFFLISFTVVFNWVFRVGWVWVMGLISTIYQQAWSWIPWKSFLTLSYEPNTPFTSTTQTKVKLKMRSKMEASDALLKGSLMGLDLERLGCQHLKLVVVSSDGLLCEGFGLGRPSATKSLVWGCPTRLWSFSWDPPLEALPEKFLQALPARSTTTRRESG